MTISFKAPKRSVNRVFIHCSASDNPKHDDVKIIREWHTLKPPKGNGWADVGYHYFIRSDGIIQPGRSLELTPAAQGGHNTGTIAICLHGLTKFTSDQFDALRLLCDTIHDELPLVTFHGHSEVSAKSCPNFDYRQVLGLNTKGQLT